MRKQRHKSVLKYKIVGRGVKFCGISACFFDSLPRKLFRESENRIKHAKQMLLRVFDYLSLRQNLAFFLRGCVFLESNALSDIGEKIKNPHRYNYTEFYI